MCTRSPRSFNSQIGVPLSVWLLNEKSKVGIFEAGISMVGEMQRLRSIIQPTIGVFTSLGDAHQENFRSLEEKCNEQSLHTSYGFQRQTNGLVYERPQRTTLRTDGADDA